ncbi:MAG: hypothetical protein KKE20_03785, partial [Nanoarchaeota archaeon]|nr:hypothetical protein [Nanoarchaeota archaeon]
MENITLNYISKKEGVDKAQDIIKHFLNLFWREFASINIKSEVIKWPKLKDIVLKSGYQRRNAYKHLHQLKFYDIFRGDEKIIFPTSFLFIINGRVYNPSLLLFENELPEELNKGEIYTLTPRLPVKVISELIKMIKTEKNMLDNLVSISFGTERYNYSQEYIYSKLPKTTCAFKIWNQHDKEISQDEHRLFSSLSPLKDPFSHNTLFDFKEGDSSPFIRLDEAKKEYIIAGWCARITDNQLMGSSDDSIESNSFIRCYDKNKKLLSDIKIVFPSSQDGIPMMAQHSTVGTRIEKSENPQFIGWYDFKNNIPTEKWLMNHVLVSFSRIKFNKETCFVKIETEKSGYFSLISIVPSVQFPEEIVRKRMKNLHSDRYRQNNEEIFIFEKAPEISEKDFQMLNEINKRLKEASFVDNKRQLLIDSYGILCRFMDRFNKILRNLIDNDTKFSGSLVRLALSLMSACLLIPLSIKNKDKELNDMIKTLEKEEYLLLKDVINHIIKTDHENQSLPALIMTHYRQFRDLKVYFNENIEIKEFRKLIYPTEQIIEKSSDIDLKMEFYKWWLNLEKNFLEKGIIYGDVQDSIKEIENIY